MIAGRHSARYDDIGVEYSRHRRVDPRLAHPITEALGDARSVLNVGAGTGSYEPTDRRVVAVDASDVMLRQRPEGSAPAVHAVAEALPFPSRSFDAVMVVLSVHHWSDVRSGLAELRRVAPRRVVLCIDPVVHSRMWLVEYIPELAAVFAHGPRVDAVVDGIDGHTVIEVPIPHDCADAMTVANWCHPEAYLDPAIRTCGSAFHLVAPAAMERGLARLSRDLASGRWRADHANLLDLDELDCGLRLVVGG